MEVTPVAERPGDLMAARIRVRGDRGRMERLAEKLPEAPMGTRSGPKSGAVHQCPGAAADPTPSIDTAGWAALGIEVPQQIEDPRLQTLDAYHHLKD